MSNKVITWEEKTEMVKLGNNATDKKTRDKFYKYVISKIDTFDLQAWSMLINLIELIPERLTEHREEVLFIYEKSKTLGKEFGLKDALRFGGFDIMCEELKENS